MKRYVIGDVYREHAGLFDRDEHTGVQAYGQMVRLADLAMVK